MSNNGANQLNLVKILTEMSSIIFAVLLALWVESWMEEQDLKDQADAALLHIAAELSQNREDLVTAIEDNSKYIDGLKGFLSEDIVDIDKLAPFLKMSSGSTSNSAWESAKMSPAMSIMPLEVVSELASIYDTQNYYSSYVNFVIQQYTDLITNIQFEINAKQSAQKMVGHLSITNNLATQLVESYDGYLGPKDSSTNE